jgi:hypothetical protein
MGDTKRDLSFDAHERAEPLCGTGWALVLGDRLEVMLTFHTGRQFAFEARQIGSE